MGINSTPTDRQVERREASYELHAYMHVFDENDIVSLLVDDCPFTPMTLLPVQWGGEVPEMCLSGMALLVRNVSLEKLVTATTVCHVVL